MTVFKVCLLICSGAFFIMSHSAQLLSFHKSVKGQSLVIIGTVLTKTFKSMLTLELLMHPIMDSLLFVVCFFFLSEYSVPLERISETQLTLCNPEKELLPMVLAHCNYTLQKGGETDTSYDLPGIQTQLARQFLAGKPLIKAVR